MFYEIYKKENLVYRGAELLSGISFENELMYTPTLSLTLPITHLEYLSEFGHMKVYCNDKVFFGLIMGYEPDKSQETVSVSLNHIVHEWTFREISINNAIKEKNINIIYQEEVEETVETTKEDIQTSKAIDWYYKRQYYVTYSVADRLGPNTYDSSACVYYALVSAGIFEQGKMGTLMTLPNDLEAGGWKKTTEPKRGDVFVFQDGTGGQAIGQAGMFIDESTVIYMSFKWNGIVIEPFSFKWASMYTLPAKAEASEQVVKKMEEIDPKVVDQIENIYEDYNFAYPGWELDFSEKAKNEKIDYVYSRQNKLDALTKTCELTEDLFWRVWFRDERKIEISEFGEQKPYILSIKPSGKTNIRIITEPNIEYDFDNVINVATVYSAKSDSGMSSLTMREIYNNTYRQEEGFPVIILKPNVNNERDYSKYIQQPKAVAPNNELEYAVIDLEGVAEAGGYLIESSFAFNDLSPFAVDNEDGKTTTITDDDRVLAATQAYKASIRKLKAARAKYKIEIETEELPTDINVGDKVRLLYDNNVIILEACSNYMKKILAYDDYFYVSHIGYSIDESGGEIDTITLSKDLVVDREELNER